VIKFWKSILKLDFSGYKIKFNATNYWNRYRIRFYINFPVFTNFKTVILLKFYHLFRNFVNSPTNFITTITNYYKISWWLIQDIKIHELLFGDFFNWYILAGKLVWRECNEHNPKRRSRWYCRNNYTAIRGRALVAKCVEIRKLDGANLPLRYGKTYTDQTLVPILQNSVGTLVVCSIS
jgi:hypothetical protein